MFPPPPYMMATEGIGLNLRLLEILKNTKGLEMAVLVTGGVDCVGSHKVWKRADNGKTISALRDAPTGQQWLLPELIHFFVGKFKSKEIASKILKYYDIDSIV